MIFGEEAKFKQLLEHFGVKGVEYDDPNAEHPAIFPAYLSIKNPLDAHNIPEPVLEALREAAKTAPKPEFERGMDQWDKRSTDPETFMQRVEDGIKDPTWSFGLTVVPDWATDVFKRFGYDGIKDNGGKMGGQGHEVWVPFEPTQIKSQMNQGPFDQNDPRISYQRGSGLRPTPPTPPEVIKEIASRYSDGDSYRRIMNDLKVSSGTVNRALGEHNIERRPTIGEEGYVHPATKDEATGDEVSRLYSEEKLSADEIAKRTGVSQPAVSKIVRRRGLTRTRSEQMTLRETKSGSGKIRGISAPWQSSKDGSWHYAHSTYEMARMHQLDQDPEVASYTKKVESVPMPNGTRYQPDLLIRYTDGRMEVEEIKPIWRAASDDTTAKATAAEKFFCCSYTTAFATRL